MVTTKRRRHSIGLMRGIAGIALRPDVYKELGYHVYSDESHTWYLVYDGFYLVGFCASIDKGSYTSFSHDYILPEHRNKGIYDVLFKFRLSRISGLIKAVATKKSLSTFLRYGFEIKRETKNYTFVEYENKIQETIKRN